MSKFTYEQVKSYIEENSDCELLSKEYKNGSEKLILRCKCGKIFERNFYNIKNQDKIQCNDCSKKNADLKMLKPIEKVLEDIYSKIGEDYELINLEYSGIHKSYLTLKHKKCNFVFKRNLKGFLNRKVICPRCESKNKTLTIEDMQNVLNKNNQGFKIIEINTQRQVTLKHEECGCVFTRAFSNFNRKTIKCPNCQSKESVGVIKISERLDKNNIQYEKEYKFKYCKDIRPLPFDFYLNDFNIAIEFDGEQHYRPTDFYGGKEKFKIRQKHDAIKNNFCKKNDINLIRINYSQVKEINSILEKKIPR